MTSIIKHLNTIIHSFSKANANSSISQLPTIIKTCSETGISFTIDANYDVDHASFMANKYPNLNTMLVKQEMDSRMNQGDLEARAQQIEQAVTLKNEVLKQFRISKYGTEDWFIQKSANEILFLPTGIAFVDGLVLGV